MQKGKNKPCRSCSNSIQRGGSGNCRPIGSTKLCSKCNTIKSLSQFHQYKNKRYHSLCNECKRATFREYQREIGRFKRHGITKEDYEKMERDQDNKCKICAQTKALYIDHCHTTNRIRGLLCRDCNTAIGLLKENIDFFRRAIDYIKDSTE